MRWLGVLTLVGVVALAAGTVNGGAVNPPGMFVAKYHLSGYGVYHRTAYFAYVAAPCQAGGKGGGNDGTVKTDTTVRWETAAPETVIVQKLPGAEPFMVRQPAPGSGAPGIVATVTVTANVANTVENVRCNLDGSEERLNVPYGTVCGTKTYHRGYWAGIDWPRVFTMAPGDRFSVSLQPLPAFQQKVSTDWKNCFLSHHQFDDARIVNGAMPFAHLPRKIRGKATGIAHGGETVIDSKNPQNGQGGSVHQYDAFTETSYVTWVRIG